MARQMTTKSASFSHADKAGYSFRHLSEQREAQAGANYLCEDTETAHAENLTKVYVFVWRCT
jgi:hypothetical protein